MPARIAAPPAICSGPKTSWNATAPVSAPTSGSRFTNAPASSADTRACAQAKSQNATSVPSSARPATAATMPAPAGAAGVPSAISATGSESDAGGAELHGGHGGRVAAGEQPRLQHDERGRAGDREQHEQIAGDRGPGAAGARDQADAASATSDPSHAPGPAVPRPAAAAKIATSTGTAPTISAAWLTLVRSMPAFWSRITAP